MIFQNVYLLLVAINFFALVPAEESESESVRVWLTVTARTRLLQVSWTNGRVNQGDAILITNQEPSSFEQIKNKNSWETNGSSESLKIIPLEENPSNHWSCNNGAIEVLETIKPMEASHWETTSIPFDFALARNVTIRTKCYGFWASYVDFSGKIIASNCVKAFPTWMNDIRSIVSDFRIRDLFLPGTHDSGSYRPGFHPSINETIVTKYALTQDEDIRGQLMHGARYLDLRVGYYRGSNEKFWVNHGFTRQRPLKEFLYQVRDFVVETNEIVIVDVQEFPVGFGKTLEIHRLLVTYIHAILGDVLVSPAQTWQSSLRNIWQNRRNVILSYDYLPVVTEFPNILFRSVEQRWANVQKWQDLERYLRRSNSFDTMRLSSRPVADMAELTPDPWGVIVDKFGGLRKLADDVNNLVTNLYRTELGQSSNIVAVDFLRSTNIVEVALEWNTKKDLL